jgi:hypothetical protein
MGVRLVDRPSRPATAPGVTCLAQKISRDALSSRSHEGSCDQTCQEGVPLLAYRHTEDGLDRVQGEKDAKLARELRRRARESRGPRWVLLFLAGDSDHDFAMINDAA